MRSRFVSGLLFITCAIPGVFVFLISVTIFGMRLLDANTRRPGWGILLVAILIGAVLVLIGIGKVSRPAYLLAFFSIPISGWLCLQIGPGGPGGSVLFLVIIGAAPCVMLWAIRRYYKQREDK